MQNCTNTLVSVAEWLQKGDGIKEFEEEYFSQETLNKAIEAFHNNDEDEESEENNPAGSAEDVEDEPSTREIVSVLESIAAYFNSIG